MYFHNLIVGFSFRVGHETFHPKPSMTWEDDFADLGEKAVRQAARVVLTDSGSMMYLMAEGEDFHQIFTISLFSVYFIPGSQG